MVDEREWQSFRADWITFLICAGIALCAFLLLELHRAAVIVGSAEGAASPVSCDGQLPDCAANRSPRR